MVLKLYGFPFSTCTKRVAVTLKEHNVPYELVVIDLPKGEQRDPAYKEIQPFGQTPAIDDDGFILYESRAICRYIAAKYASQGPHPPLLPPTTELSRFAKFEQGMSIEMCNFDPSATKLDVEKVLKPMFGQTPDEEVVKASLATLNAKLDAYEKILSKQKYIGGEDFTLADIFHLSYGHSLEVAGLGIDTLADRPT